MTGWWGTWDPSCWSYDGGRTAERRKRRQFDSAELQLLLLKLISIRSRHGYDLIREIEQLSHGAYVPSPGVVYPTITLLEDIGLIEDRSSGGQRKVYAATTLGLDHLRDRAADVEQLMGRLAGLGDDRRRAGGGPVGRAVANLLRVLWAKAVQDRADDHKSLDIAAVLDEAAQRIERME
jgi:DNA-binding PadR family transcriptional regulator